MRDTDSTQAKLSKQLVKDLKVGAKVDAFFSVNYKKPVQSYRHGFMFEFRVADRSGRVTAKYWGGPDEEAVRRLFESFDKSDVVRIKGDASDYRGVLEISVSEKDGGTVTKLEEGRYDISYLVETREDIDSMSSRLLELARTVKEPNLRKVLDAFFSDHEFVEAFSACPASIQLHSASVGGLLHHTLNVADLCTCVLEMHPELDRDLTMTGALLHDIGKVRSFKVTTSIDQTREGGLLSHIAIGDEMLVARLARIGGFPEDLAHKLRHVLLAHHGKKEWGSPVDPMMPEALLVHMADDLDAKLEYMLRRREDALTEDDWIWDSRLGRLIYLG